MIVEVSLLLSLQIEQTSSVSRFPQILQLTIELAVVINDSARGFIRDSGFFKKLRAIRLADLGPIPGSLASSDIKLSISELFIIIPL
jgi:hypothetical protein|tara:strand:- start:203 stop:463 length:261 start_codon:yes stop_codon:yes gene_type:complete